MELDVQQAALSLRVHIRNVADVDATLALKHHETSRPLRHEHASVRKPRHCPRMFEAAEEPDEPEFVFFRFDALQDDLGREVRAVGIRIRLLGRRIVAADQNERGDDG